MVVYTNCVRDHIVVLVDSVCCVFCVYVVFIYCVLSKIACLFMYLLDHIVCDF